MKKMASLFGYSAESSYEKQTVEEKLRQTRMSSNMLTADRDRCALSSGTRSEYGSKCF